MQRDPSCINSERDDDDGRLVGRNLSTVLCVEASPAPVGPGRLPRIELWTDSSGKAGQERHAGRRGCRPCIMCCAPSGP